MTTETAAAATNRRVRAAELGQKIRDATAGHPVEVSLSTSQRIIARVTDGIYREPWAAFRELCANAYDADAQQVVIETGAPRFDQIVIRDDGAGMSAETLAWVVENIGGSSKRTKDGVALRTVDPSDSDLSPGKRPMIGKIGIGLFAVAQLTQHFQIITKVKGEAYRTWATVVLKTHDEQRLKADSDKPFDAGTAHIVSERVGPDEIDSHGTTIVLHDLRPEIRNILQSAGRWQAERQVGPAGEAMLPPPKYHIGRISEAGATSPLEARLPWNDAANPLEKFEGLFKAASDPKAETTKGVSLDHLDEYLQSIWKLSLSLPLKYLDEHPFDIAGDEGYSFLELPLSGKIQELNLEPRETIRGRLNLESGKTRANDRFDILFDGVLLRRPVKLPRDLVRESRIPNPVMLVAKVEAPFPKDAIARAGGTLRFEAYLYWNSQIIPKDIQGTLIRVREASGTLFDKRFLNYQVSEQNRLSQITSEIFVLDGLDGAINIDRESFNYSHPHYIFIQKWLHRALRLFVSRLKSVAKEDLDKEKQQKAKKTREAVITEALAVWTKQQGEDSDLPTALSMKGQEPSTYRVESWLDKYSDSDRPVVESLLIVLEAYGLLNDISFERQGMLVADLLKVVRVGL